MNRTVRALVVGMFAVAGAVVFLGPTVYPFRYGPVESALLATLVVLLGFVEFVLDTTSF